ncbi:hypothetical protein [Pseudooceanicola sp.]|uniref:hypothetical protein n=1 Tax=Pseudooceanicola sp. TaxID=1914328 RepID=UPI002624DC26|nr:hypothetical protein [Pseudooceanicola sp.]MDF1857230.1 hypothetical protein [Pseudooceanicola sp.]
MSDLIITKTRFNAGIWEGVISGAEAAPSIGVSFGDDPVAGVELSALDQPGQFLIKVPVPDAAVGDGIHTIVLTDLEDGAILNSFAILAGEALTDTMRAEIDLLREELDLLKRAFRRHCVDTA